MQLDAQGVQWKLIDPENQIQNLKSLLKLTWIYEKNKGPWICGWNWAPCMDEGMS